MPGFSKEFFSQFYNKTNCSGKFKTSLHSLKFYLYSNYQENNSCINQAHPFGNITKLRFPTHADKVSSVRMPTDQESVTISFLLESYS